MDSSPDLSLKLRRGSSDSRDSFYMDFAQGIDSDIEEVDNSVIARPPPPPPLPDQNQNQIEDQLQDQLQDQPNDEEQQQEQQEQQEQQQQQLQRQQHHPTLESIERQDTIPESDYSLELIDDQEIPVLHSPILLLPPGSPVSLTNDVADYSESDVTVLSVDLPPLNEIPAPTISPPPLPPNSLPLLPRLSLISNSSQVLPPPPFTQQSQDIVSDSTTSSPSPPPTPPPPPPLSIPPPPPDPLPPRHEPHSPTLSETSTSPPMSLLFHHHHHHTHNPHFQLPISHHLQDSMPLHAQSQSQSQPQSQPQPQPQSPTYQILEQNHINSITTGNVTPSTVIQTTVTTPDTPPHHILSTGSSDPDTITSVVIGHCPQQYTAPISYNADNFENDENIIAIDQPNPDDYYHSNSNNTMTDGHNRIHYDADEYIENLDTELSSQMEYNEMIQTPAIPPVEFLENTSSLIINMPFGGPNPSVLHNIEESIIMEMPEHPPSPISPGNILVSSESVSRNSLSPVKTSSRKHSGSHHRVTIDESHNIPLSASSSAHHQLVAIGTGSPSAGSSHQQLTTTINPATIEAGFGSNSGNGGNGGNGNGPPPSGPGSSPGNGGNLPGSNLALMYHTQHHHHYPILPAIRKTSRPPFTDSRYSSSGHNYQEIKAGDALATTFSALYGKLLVVMGIAFPMAEVISTYIPPSFYEVYYLYLYVGSMLFLFFMYATLLWGRPKIVGSPSKKSKKRRSRTSSNSESMEESDTESGSSENKRIRNQVPLRRPSLLAPLGGRHYHYGSFYLRMGAVAFGIGSMIYSGLEFGQYFELERDTKCHNVMMALTPATRMAFIFIQMYFIFLNNEQIKVYRHKIIARFGLMHMIGTNLSVWLNVLIQETKHEILTFYNPENRTLRISHRLGNRMQHFDHSAHLRVARGLKGPYQIFECRRTNIIGTLVQDASPFLFPCTIEYSLICAAILYVMWRSISHPSSNQSSIQRIESNHSPMKRSPHHYSVDCARAHKGLFIGILILVLTIISLILFFVLISRPEFVTLAVTEVTICELTIYVTATIATVIGMIQVRHMQYDAARSFQLDDILLVGAQTGLFLYSTFTVIGGHFTMRKDTVLVLITALASIVQTAFQTMFILDASRRQAISPEHIRKKPGREIVTFMLVANLAMWAISTLEKSRAESHPIQLNFYGLWAWTIITHVSMPLAIFYRFHSTVCLCEIWKRAYKLKPAYM